MVGHRAGGIFRMVFWVLVLGGVAAIAFQLGLNQGVAQVVPVTGAGGTVAVPVVVGHYGWGFGFLGFLFPLFFILLIAFALRPRWGGRGYGPGRGPWGRGGWGSDQEQGADDPRQHWIAEAHRRLHEADASLPKTPDGGASTPGPGPGAGQS